MDPFKLTAYIKERYMKTKSESSDEGIFQDLVSNKRSKCHICQLGMADIFCQHYRETCISMKQTSIDINLGVVGLDSGESTTGVGDPDSGTSSRKVSVSSASISPIFDYGMFSNGINRDQSLSFQIFCDTCSVLASGDNSIFDEHWGHKYTVIEDSKVVNNNVYEPKQESKKLLFEIKLCVASCREDIDNVQRCVNAATNDNNSSIYEVRNCMAQLRDLIDARERELITEIESIKATRLKNLKANMDSLQKTLNGLSCASVTLTNVTENDSAPFEVILKANEEGFREVAKWKLVHQNFLLNPSSEKLCFKPVDSNFCQLIATAGELSMVNQLGVIGDMRFSMPKPSNEVMWRQLNFSRDYSEVTKPKLVFGQLGENPGEFNRPWGVCCDYEGNIIVADRSNNRVQIFTMYGVFVREFGSEGVENGQFHRPAGVAVDIRKCIYVTDKDNHRVQVFTFEGTFLHTFGSKGSKPGEFNYPWDIAINSKGILAISDTRNHRIQLLTSDGMFLYKYGFECTPTMWKHFDSPRGLCFDNRDSLVVTDFNNHRLILIDSNLKNSRFLGQEGGGPKQFLRPQGVAIDWNNNIIIADSRNNRIKIFDSDGNLIKHIGTVGNRPGQLDRPSGISIGPDGTIIVVDFGNNRIQLF